MSNVIKKLRSHSIVEIYYLLINKLVLLFYKLVCKFPINRFLLVFQSEGDYTDNSRVLYEYLLQHFPQYKFVWLMRGETLYPMRKNTKFIRYYSRRHSTFWGAWYIARAKYIFYTHGFWKFNKRKGQTIVNLWHGIPIKNNRLNDRDFDQEHPDYDYLITVGGLSNDALRKFLVCSERFLLPLGYPRNDLLIDSNSNGKYNPFVSSGFDGKLIMWMPTFRASRNKNISELACDNETGLPLLNDEKKLEQFNSHLIDRNVIVLVKIHHLQLGKEVFNKKFSNIIFITDEDILLRGFQLYEIVSKSDALLTDYSSVYIDYLCIDKPIGFILNDFNVYEKSRGSFIFDNIKSYMPGQHIYGMDDLYKYIEDINAGVDNFGQQRERVRNKMICFNDNRSCQRIAQYFNL